MFRACEVTLSFWTR